MPKNYIRINSVEDIDTSRINVTNINDRYVDKDGNRFATRFNIRTKKIQIVRIALGEEEAKKARGVIIQGLVKKKINETKKKLHEEHEDIHEESMETESEIHDEVSELDFGDLDTISHNEPAERHGANGQEPKIKKSLPPWLIEENIIPATGVNHEELMALMPENYKLLSERIFGVINNIKNSGIMEHVAEIDDAIDFTNIFDHTINPKMEETQKYIFEFGKYAERPEHYFTMLEKSFRTYLLELSESEIMDFLKAYFIGGTALEVLENTLIFVKNVKEKTSVSDIPLKDSSKKQFLEYAYSTCDFLTQYIHDEAAKISGWMTSQKIF